MSDTLRLVLITVAIALAPLAIVPGLIWGERRLLALWQERYGPNRVGPFGLFQSLADMLKVLTKEDWVPPFADRQIFVLAPAIIIMATFLSFGVIEYADGVVVARNFNIGLLFFLAMSSMAVYGIALGGWASNNKYALLGSLRAIGQMLSYEVFMGLSLMGVVVMVGSFDFGDIVRAQRGLWFCVPQFFGLVVFFVAALAEARRIPFDMPEAESELIAGFHTEYSGMKFAMFFLGEYVGVTLLAALMTALFFGGWYGPGPAWLGVFWFLAKTLALIGVFILMRASLPRLRYDQLMDFGWKIMLPLSLLNLLVTGAVVLWRG